MRYDGKRGRSNGRKESPFFAHAQKRAGVSNEDRGRSTTHQKDQVRKKGKKMRNFCEIAVNPEMRFQDDCKVKKETVYA